MEAFCLHKHCSATQINTLGAALEEVLRHLVLPRLRHCEILCRVTLTFDEDTGGLSLAVAYKNAGQQAHPAEESLSLLVLEKLTRHFQWRHEAEESHIRMDI